jgi:hypothetical protein
MFRGTLAWSQNPRVPYQTGPKKSTTIRNILPFNLVLTPTIVTSNNHWIYSIFLKKLQTTLPL